MANLPTQSSTSNMNALENLQASMQSYASQTPIQHSTRVADRADSPSENIFIRQLVNQLEHRERYSVAAPSNMARRNPVIRGSYQGDRRDSTSGSRDTPRPMLKRLEPWQTWPELTVRVGSLPENINTWDLWKRFNLEGTVVFVEIFEDRQGTRDGNAKIRFSPPPRRAFWALDNVKLPTPDGQGEIQVRVMPEPKRRSFKIQSPINKNIWYDEVYNLYPSSLAFGVMCGPSTMMEMHNVQSLSRNDTAFKIDLLRGRIEVTFQVSFTDSATHLSGAEGQTHPGELDRTNSFVFWIPFGQLQKLDRVQVSDSRWALVISLDSPPRFYRKRLDPMASHSTDALTWSEYDTWFRQTDIVYDPRLLENAVVALKKESPVVDIGRWTTYYLLFEKHREEHGVFNCVKNSLHDHNIEICDRDDFEVIPRVPVAIIDPNIAIGPMVQENPNHDISEYPLPFKVRYQLEVCISQGIINEHNIGANFLARLSDTAREDEIKVMHILEYAAEQEKRIYDPMTLFNDVGALAYSPHSKPPYYCVSLRKVTVTPTTLYCSSPMVEISNRVVRKYTEDRFLRVQFTDEKFEGRINPNADKARDDEIFTRVYRTLLNGIRLGDRHYQFLAFGNSQFRENGAYFFCPTQNLTCDDIRQWMGDFSTIKVVAKYAARLGLCFSTTRAIHSPHTKLLKIPDVERHGYCFTDGVGKVSDSISSRIAIELKLPLSNPSPVAFQFRLGGAKGMLVNWPGMERDQIAYRDSQFKFNAAFKGLEIIRCSRYSPATLNRQTITILSSLGVPDAVFNRMLSEQLSNYAAAMTNKEVCMNLLGRYIDENHMTITIARMVLDGFMDVKEPFFLSLLHLWRAWSVKQLKEKAKIIVEQGAFLLGVTDETKTLRGHFKRPEGLLNLDELPQVFIQVPDQKKKGAYVVIDGPCLVGRNPSLYPGDIRLVQAIDVPALHHLRDVVVFSQLGERDVPSMCSGGDLDGDDFFCIWDRDLIPPECNVEPMSYVAPKPTSLNRPVEIKDVIKFFVRYMKNDALPTIAHAHMAHSDFLDRGVKDPKCVELAELHSKAVDYVKTGEAAELPKRLRPRKWPHFMEKSHKPKDQIYVSAKILGQLYDKVESVDFVPQYDAPFDKRILQGYSPDSTMMKTVRQLKTKYDTAVRRLMAQHEIKTEFEIWSTFVLSKPRVGSDYKMQEEMATVSDALKDRFRQACIVAAQGNEPKVLRPFVAAMYRVTHEEMEHALRECREKIVLGGSQVPKRKMEPKYMPLISFPWLFHDILGRIATGEERDGLENFGSITSNTKKARKFNPDGEYLDPDEWIETTHGIIHRGELLDLFAPDDIDSEGEPIEQPYRDRSGNKRTRTTSGVTGGRDGAGDGHGGLPPMATEDDNSLGNGYGNGYGYERQLHHTNTSTSDTNDYAAAATTTPSQSQLQSQSQSQSTTFNAATLNSNFLSRPHLARAAQENQTPEVNPLLDISGELLDFERQQLNLHPFISPSAAELAFLENSGDLIGSVLEHQDPDPSYSASIADLDFLKTPYDDYGSSGLRHNDSGTYARYGRLSATAATSSDDRSSLGIWGVAESAQEPFEGQVSEDYNDFEEIVLGEEEDESPMEKLARLTGC